MNNESTNFDFPLLFFEIHSGLPREAPGSAASTTKAYSAIKDLPSSPAILDIGCGPGAQSILLAKLSCGHVTSVDNHQPFLDEVNRRASEAGLSGNVKTVNASMFDVEFEERSFDLIWAEGSIYIIGYEQGLKSWGRFLKPGGYIAFSECCWLKDSPPDEITAFWQESYPGMTSINQVADTISKCGFQNLEHFVLPNSDWENYYKPVESKINVLRKKYAGNTEALQVLDAEEYEIRLFRNYSE